MSDTYCLELERRTRTRFGFHDKHSAGNRYSTPLEKIIVV
jgi:hypothetical protein